MVQWAKAQSPPCPWNENTCHFAAEGGYLELLQWARAQSPPCPWVKMHCEVEARRNGFAAVVEWLQGQEG